MLALDLGHLARDEIQGLVPRSPDQLAVPADQRRRQPLVAVEVAPALAALDARLALARRVVLLARDLLDDAILDLEGQTAAHAAEATDRVYFPRAIGLAVLSDLRLRRNHRPRLTSCCSEVSLIPILASMTGLAHH